MFTSAIQRFQTLRAMYIHNIYVIYTYITTWGFSTKNKETKTKKKQRLRTPWGFPNQNQKNKTKKQYPPPKKNRTPWGPQPKPKKTKQKKTIPKKQKIWDPMLSRVCLCFLIYIYIDIHIFFGVLVGDPPWGPKSMFFLLLVSLFFCWYWFCYFWFCFLGKRKQ